MTSTTFWSLVDSVSSHPGRALLRWLVSASEYPGIGWIVSWWAEVTWQLAWTSSQHGSLQTAESYRALSTRVPVSVVESLSTLWPRLRARSLGATPSYSWVKFVTSMWVPGRVVSVFLHVKKWITIALLLRVARHLGLRWDELLAAESRLQDLKYLLLVLSGKLCQPLGLEDTEGTGQDGFPAEMILSWDLDMTKHWLWEAGYGPSGKEATILRWDEGSLGARWRFVSGHGATRARTGVPIVSSARCLPGGLGRAYGPLPRLVLLRSWNKRHRIPKEMDYKWNAVIKNVIKQICIIIICVFLY